MHRSRFLSNLKQRKALRGLIMKKPESLLPKELIILHGLIFCQSRIFSLQGKPSAKAVLVAYSIDDGNLLLQRTEDIGNRVWKYLEALRG